MQNLNRDALEGAYREAHRAVHRATETAQIEAHREIASGKGSVNPAFYSGRTIEATRVAMGTAVDTLVTAHIHAGDRHETTVSDRIRAFVSEQAVGRFPTPHSRSVGLQLRNDANSKAHFEMMRAGLANRVKDLVAVALLKERATTTLTQRIEKWASNNRLVATAIVAVTAIAAIWKAVDIVIDVVGKVRPLLRR